MIHESNDTIMTQVIDMTTTTDASINVIGFDILTPLLDGLFGPAGLLMNVTGSTNSTGILGFIVGVWNVYVVLAYAVSFVFLYVYVYAATQLNKLEISQAEYFATQENMYARSYTKADPANRFSELREQSDSDNPNDWKLSIIEADIMMDEELKRLGYAGSSIGERLRSISPTTMRTLDDAWEAHKIRNQIAHAGPDFVLTKRLAHDTLLRYGRVFAELGID